MVWQALGADPRLISAASAAERLAADRRPPHLVWNPLSGDFVQLIPVVRAACSLGGPEGLDYRTGGYGGCGHEAGTGAVPHPANREGRLCVQVGVVAWAWEPFTDTPLHGVDGLLSWLASWGVPARWPAGQPAPFRLARTGERSRAHWALGGHFAASQVPGWDAAGPGAIDIELLGAPASVCTAIGVPRPAAWRSGRSGRSEALSHTRRVALERMLGPDIDDDLAGAGVAPRSASLANAGQRALPGDGERRALFALTGGQGDLPD